MSAVLLSIGTELTRGELLNTNALWLAEELTQLGVNVDVHLSVPDDSEKIGWALREMIKTHRVLIATGGLGPTSDDLTTLAVGEAVGLDLVRDSGVLEALKRRYQARGRTMAESNAKQADFPAGAVVLENPVGTAPGFMLTLEGCDCYFLPGVPTEMKAIFASLVQPRVAGLGDRTEHQICLRTFGLPEAVIADRLAELEAEHDGLVLGYRASFPEVEVKVRMRATSEAEAETRAQAVAVQVRERLEGAVYGEGDDSFPAYVGRLLRERGLHLALAESCTGGMVGSMITDIPGSSDYLLFDAVTYSNAAKCEILGVSEDELRAYGAVSAECAAAMAEGAIRLSGADFAVSITGIAGPGGGTEQKPVGTVWIGVGRKHGPTETIAFQFSGDRRRIRTLTAYHALNIIAEAVASS